MKLQIFTLDKPNKNKRIYPRSVIEREVKKYRKTFIKENRAIVVRKQPRSSTLNLMDAIGVIKKITIQKDKVFVEMDMLHQMHGAAEIEKGLREGKLGLSTIGVGTFTITKRGITKIHDDYEFIGCFVTNDPA